MNRAEIIKEALRTGRDPHTATAAAAFGIPPEQVTREQRNQQKMWNYVYLYSNSNPFSGVHRGPTT